MQREVVLDSLVTEHNPTSNKSESSGARICKYGQHLAAPRNENGNVVKEKLVMLFRRFVLFARNVGRNRPNNNVNVLRLKLEWPYVMNSSLAMHRPFVSRTWHHGYYRTRR